jgi:predicted CXXCH cytochrome family protein
MHASQGTDDMVYGTYGSSTRQPSLLRNNCTGCHAGTNTPTSLANDQPYVFTPSDVDYGSTGTTGNTLAGGNFYWLTQGDTAGFPKGHNIVGLVGPDTNHPSNTPPGGAAGEQLTCAGLTGCHGDRIIDNQVMSIRGAHHSDSTLSVDGSSVKRSYRWLDGIKGYEDTDYEYQPDRSTHNQYKGQDRTGDDNTNTATMSHFCADCHGDFHFGASTAGVANATFASPWIRHPTDYDMDLTAGTEYASFNKGIGVKFYSVTVPLASTDVSSPIANVGADSAIVMCLSCHRAHGSPYDSILRWDYKAWPAGGYNGCVICHTTKD